MRQLVFHCDEDTAQVRRNLIIEAGNIGVGDWRWRQVDASIVEGNVEAAVTLDCFSYETLDLMGVAHVRFDIDDLAASGPDPPLHFAPECFSPAVESNLGSGLS